MDIKTYVQQKKEDLKNRVAQAERKPHLTIVKMNEDAASEAYVRGKVKDCHEVGIDVEVKELPLNTTQEALYQILDDLNQDPNVDGYIVQMPLPKHIKEEEVKRRISPLKDVDGFHPLSSFSPCTPKGAIDYLRFLGVDFKGKNAVVLGRSHIVGRPLAKMLLDLDTNCVVLHTKTKEEDKKFYIEHADLIFTAIGKKWILADQYHYKKDAIIVDIGISREEGHLYGDCARDLPVALQTPVPGGVGLLTRYTLLENVWEAYQNGISHH